MIKKLFNQKGTTMVELLIYMGLLAILLAILTDMFVAVLNLKADMNVTSFNEQDGRFILARLEQDISDSQSITTPNTNGSTTSTLSIVKAGVTYSYVVSGDYFQLTSNAGTFNLNSSETKIENVSFKRLGNGSKDTVQIKYTVTSKILKNGKYDSINFQTTVGIR